MVTTHLCCAKILRETMTLSLREDYRQAVGYSKIAQTSSQWTLAQPNSLGQWLINDDQQVDDKNGSRQLRLRR
jgi:hypothetical protein